MQEALGEPAHLHSALSRLVGGPQPGEEPLRRRAGLDGEAHQVPLGGEPRPWRSSAASSRCPGRQPAMILRSGSGSDPRPTAAARAGPDPARRAADLHHRGSYRPSRRHRRGSLQLAPHPRQHAPNLTGHGLATVQPVRSEDWGEGLCVLSHALSQPCLEVHTHAFSREISSTSLSRLSALSLVSREQQGGRLEPLHRQHHPRRPFPTVMPTRRDRVVGLARRMAGRKGAAVSTSARRPLGQGRSSTKGRDMSVDETARPPIQNGTIHKSEQGKTQ